jgi:glucose/arabinose dehydrogenase
MLLFTVDNAGTITQVDLPEQFDDTSGRPRAVCSGPGGALYVTTSDGSDDKVLRLTAGSGA